ncbi:MAG: dihydropteroate synthase [Pseudomonadota bacterium]
MTADYYRPLPQVGVAQPSDALPLAGGWSWATHAEHLRRDAPPKVVSIGSVPASWRDAWTVPRMPIAGVDWSAPRVMGVVNATPDSFSDGGRDMPASLAHVETLGGADILDIGGESTRPGAQIVPPEIEIARTAPLIAALRDRGLRAPVSIDTRKAVVAEAALEAGANIVNDVSGFTFDSDLAPLCAARAVPVCVMHAQGDPATMQNDPRYDNVLLDVYDFLAARITALRALGITQIIADPGIGFGKTQAHNLAILTRLSLFHGLGVPILLGVSRKGFIGRIGGADAPADRDAGSMAVALGALGQGIQLIRAHDVTGHVQAIALWQASVSETKA